MAFRRSARTLSLTLTLTLTLTLALGNPNYNPNHLSNDRRDRNPHGQRYPLQDRKGGSLNIVWMSQS